MLTVLVMVMTALLLVYSEKKPTLQPIPIRKNNK
jgi:hypothetical protein